MKVNHVLILSAGKGTRMGDIGQKLPKILWPIFEKSLLELEVEYAKSLYPDAQIYINVYNYSQKVISFMRGREAFKNIEIVEEHEELDIGGAIHNLAKKINYQGNLLTINSDQFLFCDKDHFHEAGKIFDEFDSILFIYDVKKSDGYNGLQIRKNRLQSIIPNMELIGENTVTYTGMSVIKLNKLKPREGKLKFFEAVANPQKQQVGCIKLEGVDYWDFGTLPRYHQNMFRILKLQKSSNKFIEFLIKMNALEVEKLRDDSYNSVRGINLGDQNADLAKNDILLKGKYHAQDNEPKIIMNELVAYINTLDAI